MSSAIDSAILEQLASTARGRLRLELEERMPSAPTNDSHLVTYGRQLIDWVFSGKIKPGGATTAILANAVKAAVNYALLGVYGSTSSNRVDANICVRRDAL